MCPSPPSATSQLPFLGGGISVGTSHQFSDAKLVDLAISSKVRAASSRLAKRGRYSPPLFLNRLAKTDKMDISLGPKAVKACLTRNRSSTMGVLSMMNMDPR